MTNDRFLGIMPSYSTVTEKGPQWLMASVTFWATTSTLQRFFGAMSMHGGRRGIFVSSAGLISVVSCSVASLALTQGYKINQWVSAQVDQITKGVNIDVILKNLKFPDRDTSFDDRKLMKFTIASVVTFSFIEHNLFRTMLPSSVLTLGVFGNTMYTNSRSVPTSTELTTEAQRKAIQVIGRRSGCHHCGSRQILTRETFIADHMPPTKVVKEMNSVWWRKFLRLEVTQRLWAQCQKCYSKQGSAVRANVHRLAYHSLFRIHHFSPAIALYLLDIPQIDYAFEMLTDDLIELWKSIRAAGSSA